MADLKPEAPQKKRRQREYSWITPRFWHGMLFSTWCRLVVRHRFSISPSRMPMAVAITFFSGVNSLLRLLQEALLGRRIERIQIARTPLFVIGHWRSGTTMLHELMVLDPQHNSPTTYECMAPNHFLITAWYVTRWFNFVLPDKRPMDNMATGWRKPQEDEFALCNLGLPSPYLTMAFPNHPPECPEYLDLKGLTPDERARWKAGLLWFLKRITWQDSRRIVLKSPPHTARVATLLEMFPDAQFIHIVRDPFEVFSSTERLWKSLYQVQALQAKFKVDQADYEESIFQQFEQMYAAFEADRHLLRPGQLYEVRYEDLVQDMVGQMQAIYEHLNLGDFDDVRPRLQRYVDGVKDYRTNQHQLPAPLREKILKRWGTYIERHGYGEARSGAAAQE